MEMFELQESVKIFNESVGWDAKSQLNAYQDATSLLEESGELAREIRRFEQNGVRQGHEDVYTTVQMREMLMEEIGDVQFALLTIANRYNIPMEEVIYRFNQKMSERSF